MQRPYTSAASRGARCVILCIVRSRYWVPGLNDDIDRDESLRIGFEWLADAERETDGAGIIVMYAKRMMHNAPLLAWAAQRWEFVSTRSSYPSRRGPVLAIWPPTERVLEFAEDLASDSPLCVIAGRLDLRPWIARTGAECLAAGWELADEQASLPDEAVRLLDSALFFGGRNGFISGGEKEQTIRSLRLIAALPNRPAPEQIEYYLRASGQTHAKGVQRAVKWYEEVLEGKRHLDYSRRPI